MTGPPGIKYLSKNTVCKGVLIRISSFRNERKPLQLFHQQDSEHTDNPLRFCWKNLCLLGQPVELGPEIDLKELGP